ncbi:MAG: hypothetical protein IMY76_03990 [Chloroflexi bacterium]|nr:hypothetical protein [Chloroflexota bacterium]
MKFRIGLFAVCILLIVFLFACTTKQIFDNNNDTEVVSKNQPSHTHIPDLGQDVLPPSFNGLLELYSNEPVFQRGLDRTWDQAIVDPGVILSHNGIFHVFYNGIQHYSPLRGGTYDSTLQKCSVGYAVSTDGYDWYRMTDSPIITLDDIGYETYNARVSSVVLTDDGTWVMYIYTQSNDSIHPPGVILRATADNPAGPWIFDDFPILSPGSNGTWDSYALRFPDVIRTDDGYSMYYTGYFSGTSQGSTNALMGLATSRDGVTWSKWDNPITDDDLFRESDPVFGPGDADWGRRSLKTYRVWQTTDGWNMIFALSLNYFGTSSFGYASSSDGTTWHHFEGNPVFSSQDLRNATSVGCSDIIYINGKYYFYFNASKDEFTGDIYLAISE